MLTTSRCKRCPNPACWPWRSREYRQRRCSGALRAPGLAVRKLDPRSLPTDSSRRRKRRTGFNVSEPTIAILMKQADGLQMAKRGDELPGRCHWAGMWQAVGLEGGPGPSLNKWDPQSLNQTMQVSVLAGDVNALAAGQGRNPSIARDAPQVPVAVDVVAVAGQRAGLRVKIPFAGNPIQRGRGDMVERVVAI